MIIITILNVSVPLRESDKQRHYIVSCVDTEYQYIKKKESIERTNKRKQNTQGIYKYDATSKRHTAFAVFAAILARALGISLEFRERRTISQDCVDDKTLELALPCSYCRRYSY